MAKVFRTVGGRKLTKVIALTHEAQQAIEEKALFGGMAAEGYLLHAKHRTFTSQIVVEEGDVDRYVVLDDTRGLDAALTIEYGRKDHMDPVTGKRVAGMEGLFPLHKAFPALQIDKRPNHGGDNLNE